MCQTRDNVEYMGVCVPVSICPCVRNVPAWSLCTFMWVCRGAVGGQGNVRNVEECNQNVLLCGQKKKKEKTWRKRNTVASSWEWSELWTSERSDGVGRTSEQTLHSFPQPFKQPGVTMETPLCVFPNYPNPLHILSHTHRDTHTKHKKTHKHTHIHTHTFGLTIPLPPSMHTNTANSHPVTHSFSLGSVRKTLYWYSQRAREVSWPRWWPAGVWSWRGCVCPPLWSGRGGPRWGAPSWASLGSSPPETHKQFKKKKKSSFLNAPHTTLVLLLQRGNRIFTFLSSLAQVLVRPQTTHKAQGCLMQLGRRIKLVEQRAVLQWLHKIGVALNWAEGFALSSFFVTSP